jgi:hypothetical protein
VTASRLPARRIPGGEDQGSAPRRGLLAADDWAYSTHAAVITAGVIGALLAAYAVAHGIYVAACDVNHVLYHLGALLAAAANGA